MPSLDKKLCVKNPVQLRTLAYKGLSDFFCMHIFNFRTIRQVTFKQIKNHFFFHQNFLLNWGKCLRQHEKPGKKQYVCHIHIGKNQYGKNLVRSSVCYRAVNVMTFTKTQQMLQKKPSAASSRVTCLWRVNRCKAEFGLRRPWCLSLIHI